jgi:hypothetical protein
MKVLAAVAVVVVAGVAGIAGAGCKGDPVRCESAIRNYTTLVFWETADKDIEKAPEADRAKLRADKLAEYETTLAKGIDTLTSQCVSANNDTQVQCMIDAKTAKDAHACTE